VLWQKILQHLEYLNESFYTEVESLEGRRMPARPEPEDSWLFKVERVRVDSFGILEEASASDNTGADNVDAESRWRLKLDSIEGIRIE
jgi:hypothetical protein